MPACKKCTREFSSTPQYLEATDETCPNCLIIQGLAPAVCENCGHGFVWAPRSYHAMGLTGLPKRCPKCNDEKQARPTVVLDRRQLWFANVRLGTSVIEPLKEAEVFQPKGDDRPVRRLVIKGDRYGAEWNGRIDVYIRTNPHGLELVANDVVTLAHMEAKAKVWVKRWERATMEHGTVNGYRRCLSNEEGAEEKVETSQYVSILPAPESAESVGTLVAVSAHTKTTIKGLGRQYWAHIEGKPLWSMSVSGGARSGRFHTTAMLAVVEEGNPLVHVHKEGGEETRVPIMN